MILIICPTTLVNIYLIALNLVIGYKYSLKLYETILELYIFKIYQCY